MIKKGLLAKLERLCWCAKIDDAKKRERNAFAKQVAKPRFWSTTCWMQGKPLKGIIKKIPILCLLLTCCIHVSIFIWLNNTPPFFYLGGPCCWRIAKVLFIELEILIFTKHLFELSYPIFITNTNVRLRFASNRTFWGKRALPS